MPFPTAPCQASAKRGPRSSSKPSFPDVPAAHCPLHPRGPFHSHHMETSFLACVSPVLPGVRDHVKSCFHVPSGREGEAQGRVQSDSADLNRTCCRGCVQGLRPRDGGSFPQNVKDGPEPLQRGWLSPTGSPGPFPRRACDSREGRAGAWRGPGDSDVPSRSGQGLLVPSVPFRTFRTGDYFLAASGSTGPQAPPWPSPAARGGQAGSWEGREAAAP